MLRVTRRFLHGVRQAWWDTRDARIPIDYRILDGILTPELLTLFQRMSRNDQHHGIRVMDGIKSVFRGGIRVQGHDENDLLVAALLHDVGKGRYPYTVLDRILAKITKFVAPDFYQQRGQGEPSGFWRPLVIAMMHPEWSAVEMEDAGASSRAVSLARRHQDKIVGEPQSEEDRLLLILQSVDDRV